MVTRSAVSKNCSIALEIVFFKSDFRRLSDVFSWSIRAGRNRV